MVIAGEGRKMLFVVCILLLPLVVIAELLKKV